MKIVQKCINNHKIFSRLCALICGFFDFLFPILYFFIAHRLLFFVQSTAGAGLGQELGK
jgi:hypothetical protein